MDPIIGGALINAGGGLLGGLFGKKTSAGKNFRSHINGLMAAAAQHKINPLALLGVNPIGPSDSPNYMGAAIQDAAAYMADAMGKTAKKEGLLSRLTEQNKELERKVQDLTLRPIIGGIYDRTVTRGDKLEMAKPGDADFVGPRQPVQVYNAVSGRKFGLDPFVADRLGITDGMPWFAEDMEAVAGEIATELSAGASVVDGMVKGNDFTKPSPQPKDVPEVWLKEPTVDRWGRKKPEPKPAPKKKRGWWVE